MPERSDQCVDIASRVVECEPSTNGALQAKASQDRLSAIVGYARALAEVLLADFVLRELHKN
jgi:hypothetical protein